MVPFAILTTKKLIQHIGSMLVLTLMVLQFRCLEFVVLECHMQPNASFSCNITGKQKENAAFDFPSEKSQLGIFTKE